ncbi:hypothetical protein BaRGS_00002970 [Batillaria attramentaria]|uniref:Uncharacterized protein n=1 Tax=Batillaria attramentaria TaxID=370345 RepID=A0ABD0M1A3_9CAEN
MPALCPSQIFLRHKLFHFNRKGSLPPRVSAIQSDFTSHRDKARVLHDARKAPSLKHGGPTTLRHLQFRCPSNAKTSAGVRHFAAKAKALAALVY